jgi:hypothetical protein
MNDKLLPCPNLDCGSDPDDIGVTWASEGDPFYVFCPDCWVHGPEANTRAEAIALWNTAFLRKEPWVKIGEGEGPKGNWLKPCWVKHRDGVTIGYFYRSSWWLEPIGGNRTLLWDVTEYQLIPEPPEVG